MANHGLHASKHRAELQILCFFGEYQNLQLYIQRLSQYYFQYCKGSAFVASPEGSAIWRRVWGTGQSQRHAKFLGRCEVAPTESLLPSLRILLQLLLSLYSMTLTAKPSLSNCKLELIYTAF